MIFITLTDKLLLIFVKTNRANTLIFCRVVFILSTTYARCALGLLKLAGLTGLPARQALEGTIDSVLYFLSLARTEIIDYLQDW
jgi:hypothetical protein